ncbi:MAG: hypothetical protein C4541_04235 [Candidatus Auribacter fodinae]|jgi:tetratricopeptide (TPR) repeat protein|uniref:O-antigen ligase-related domain-containing protein n=1 Tax=Candidatus Auribacter fodinae TaxID=2093366 RepID=A0A3A4R6P6_9BACT|nr:MAG: hypothetical protein C4541_04235 [Candidatus Auribacter fodinae]
MANDTNSFSFQRVIFLLLAGCIGLALFVVPVKLGSPYIDEIGFRIPSVLEFIFSSWPAVYLFFISAMVLFFCCLDSLNNEKIIISFKISGILLAVFLCVSVCSYWWSVNAHASKAGLIILISATAGYGIARKAMLHPLNHLLVRIVYISILSAGTFIALIGIHQYFFGLQEMRTFIDMDTLRHMAVLYKNSSPEQYALYLRIISDRIFSTFVYPNTLAGYICMVLPFSFSVFFLEKTERNRILKIVFMIIAIVGFFWFYVQNYLSFMPFVILGTLLFPLTLVLCLVLTGSSGGLITGMLVVFLFLLTHFFKKRRIPLRIIISLILVLSILITCAVWFTQTKKRASLQARFDYWDAGVRMVHDRPLAGFGYNTFGTIYPAYKNKTDEETQFAHNNFIQLFIETGAVGGVLFLLMWCYPLLIFLRKSGSMPLPSVIFPAYFALLAFLFHSFLDFDFFIPALAFYAFFMLGIIDISQPFKVIVKHFEKTGIKKAAVVVIFIFFIIIMLPVRDIVRSHELYALAEYVFINEKNIAAAYELVDEAIRINPENSRFYKLKSSIYMNQKQYLDAMYNLKKAVELNVYRGSYHYDLAQLYDKIGNTEKAELEFSKAIKYNPSRYTKNSQ